MLIRAGRQRQAIEMKAICILGKGIYAWFYDHYLIAIISFMLMLMRYAPNDHDSLIIIGMALAGLTLLWL